jgi:hypothetical protein
MAENPRPASRSGEHPYTDDPEVDATPTACLACGGSAAIGDAESVRYRIRACAWCVDGVMGLSARRAWLESKRPAAGGST